MLRKCLRTWIDVPGIERYPQETRCIRLPFGPRQTCVDQGKELLDWRALLYWFKKLDPVDLDAMERPRGGSRPISGLGAGRRDIDVAESRSAYRRGEELLETGLTGPGSRNESQYYVLYFLWRNGYRIEDAIRKVLDWLKANHNGFSSEAKAGRWRIIETEIARQSEWIWNHYVPPANPSYRGEDGERGWTTAEEPLRILLACEGEMRPARFLYHLVRYYHGLGRSDGELTLRSRIMRNFDSGTAYLDMIERLERSGVIRRGSGYRVGREAKHLAIRLPLDHRGSPFLVDGSSPRDLEDALAALYPDREVMDLLKENGLDSRVISAVMRSLAKKRHPNR